MSITMATCKTLQKSMHSCIGQFRDLIEKQVISGIILTDNGVSSPFNIRSEIVLFETVVSYIPIIKPYYPCVID